jgi:hypothetical protein
VTDDDNGDVTGMIDACGVVTTITCDSLNRPTGRSYSEAPPSANFLSINHAHAHMYSGRGLIEKICGILFGFGKKSLAHWGRDDAQAADGPEC